MKRWSIALLLGIGVLINYFDRTNMSVATTPLMHQYHLDKAQFGILLSSFAWSYAILQIPIGPMLDRIGVKWLVRVGTIIWAIATYLTAAVSGMGLIILSRILLGIGEAPAFPAASKATGYWFPVRERGLATSIFDAAAKFSNVVGAALLGLVVTEYGWRAGFYFTAVLSLIFAIFYWILYRDPKEMKSLSKEEYDYIKEGGAQDDGAAPGGTMKNLRFLLKQRKIWGMTLGFAAYGYTFYLFLTWLPGYLETEMHMSVLKSALYTVIPWSFATVTDLVIGGWLVDKLIKTGYNPTRVRKTIVTVGMILGLAVFGAAFTKNPHIAIVFITISLSGLAFAAPVGWSIPSLIAPKGTVGMVGSIMNFANNVMGILAPIVTGFVANGSAGFGPGFAIAGVVLIIGILCYVFMIGEIKQIQSPFENKSAALDTGH